MRLTMGIDLAAEHREARPMSPRRHTIHADTTSSGESMQHTGLDTSTAADPPQEISTGMRRSGLIRVNSSLP